MQVSYVFHSNCKMDRFCEMFVLFNYFFITKNILKNIAYIIANIIVIYGKFTNIMQYGKFTNVMHNMVNLQISYNLHRQRYS